MSTLSRTIGLTQRTEDGPATDRPMADRAQGLVARRYRLESVLGRGAMGLVWLAADTMLHRPVALKQVLTDDHSAAPTPAALWKSALHEAQAAARVNHAGAVRVHDVVAEDRRPWIVMEPLSGRTLRETLNAEGPLPVGQVARIGLELLTVLRAMHRVGLVHLDVKPSNVHLCDNERVVLTDFGIACTVDEPRPAGTIAGSPAYVAPERLDGPAVGPACDLFSLGATLFAAVEGRLPFDEDPAGATFTAVAENPPAPFRRAGPLRPVIEGLLDKDPARRLTSDQTHAALQDVMRRPRCANRGDNRHG